MRFSGFSVVLIAYHPRSFPGELFNIVIYFLFNSPVTLLLVKLSDTFLATEPGTLLSLGLALAKPPAVLAESADKQTVFTFTLASKIYVTH